MILDTIVEDKKHRLQKQKEVVSEDEMKEKAIAWERVSYSFYQALKKDGLSIIGEFKQASPSLGIIKHKINLEERMAYYNQSVDAVSCLTEEDHFHGNREYFERIRNMTKLPMIRKDFIFEDYQVYESKIMGADAILLIAAILKQEQLSHLYHLSYELGMDVLLEVHNKEEMFRASSLGAKIIGINNRDLKDFSIRLETTKELVDYRREIESALLPKQKEELVLVSESGVTEQKHIEFLRDQKVDALLIGRAFMESYNPMALAKKWKEVYDLQ